MKTEQTSFDRNDNNKLKPKKLKMKYKLKLIFVKLWCNQIKFYVYDIGWEWKQNKT